MLGQGDVVIGGCILGLGFVLPFSAEAVQVHTGIAGHAGIFMTRELAKHQIGFGAGVAHKPLLGGPKQVIPDFGVLLAPGAAGARGAAELGGDAIPRHARSAPLGREPHRLQDRW